MKKNNIVIVGAGYVGMSLATLLSINDNVNVIDIDKKKINKILNKESPILDKLISKYLKTKKLLLSASIFKKDIYKKANFIIISTPTSYNKKTSGFDTSSVEGVIKDIITSDSRALIIIKSTVPTGFTNKMQKKYSTEKILFIPEFLKEGSALYDNLYPSRIIVGGKKIISKKFVQLLTNAALKKNIPTVYMKPNEAEAVKLFSNTYLAMRISFFNELDSYALDNNLDSKDLITGVCLDDRIGDFYNNPSFGYGGYCLPKDTKQLLSNFDKVPQKLIKAIIDSNQTRKKFITKKILELNPKNIGIYRLIMKSNSDNYRSSSVIDIIKHLKLKKINIFIYEPQLNTPTFFGCEVIKESKKMLNKCDVILANRTSAALNKAKGIVFTRDIFNKN